MFIYIIIFSWSEYLLLLIHNHTTHCGKTTKPKVKEKGTGLDQESFSSQNLIFIMRVKSLAPVSWQRTNNIKHQQAMWTKKNIKRWRNQSVIFFFAAFAVGPYQTGPFGGPLSKRDEGENRLHFVDLYRSCNKTISPQQHLNLDIWREHRWVAGLQEVW